MSRTCQTWSGFKVQGLQEPILILCLFRSIRWITRRIFRHVFPETVTCHTPTLKNDPQVETQDVPSCLARICGNENIHPPRRSAVPFSYPNLQSMPISTIWGSFVYTIFVMGGVSCATACTSASCESGGCGFQWMHFLRLRAKATEPAVCRVQCRSRYFPRNGRRELFQKTPLTKTLVSCASSGDSEAIIFYGKFLAGLVACGTGRHFTLTGMMIPGD